jgi:hypothetical protein
MLQNSGSVTTRINPPLSPAERAERYRRGLRELRDPKSYPIPITEEFVRGLLKQGYLWPNERDDLDAIHEAMSLFLWDSFRKLTKPKNTKCPIFGGDEAIDG